MARRLRITIPSFSKTNWSLEILGKRSDGFHELLTVLQTLDFGDEISLETPSEGITLVTEGREVTGGADNLVFKAACLLKERIGTNQGVHVKLTKRIPVGAGLGGGSSNAAMTLVALNQLWDCRLTRRKLLELAAKLGSDVPFFLTGGTGLGWGRGEEVSPLPDLPEEFSVLIYYPRFQVSAADAYAGLRDLPGKLTRPDLDTTIRRFREALEAGNWSAMGNDLEDPVFSFYPMLAEKKRKILAECEFGMLSGSGSALVGISAADSLEEARKRLGEAADADIILCRTLSRKEYFDSLKEAGIHTELFSV